MTPVFPRVLVVDPSPFNRTRNNGMVKSSFFEGWPKRNLAQIDYSNLPVDFDVCENYWRITKLDALRCSIWLKPFYNRLDRSMSAIDRAERRPRIEQRMSRLAPPIKLAVSEAVLRLPGALSREMHCWLSEFRPQVIYSILGTGPIIRWTVLLAQRYAIPIVPYFTDDWANSLYSNGMFEKPWRRSMLRWLNRCFNNAPLRLTCSSLMAREYSERFGGHFEALHYPIERKRDRPIASLGIQKNTFNLVYLGALEPGRWRTLMAIVDTLRSLADSGLAVSLKVYSFPADLLKYGSLLNRPPCGVVLGTVSPDEVISIQDSADCLVHVESFERADYQYARLSLSTKIPQYLGTGRPIVAVGPGDCASIAHLRDCNAAAICTSLSQDEIGSTVSRLMNDPDLRHGLAQRALDAAGVLHHPLIQREKMRSLLSRVAGVDKVGVVS